MQRFSLHTLATIIVLAVGLSGCKSIEERGYVIDEEKLVEIEVGKTKDQVRRIMGSPSSISSLGSEIWYYIGVKQEKSAFSQPDIVGKQIIAVHFDGNGAVSEVVSNDDTDQRDIQFAEDITPTEGHKIGVIEQLIGNVGRFNTQDR